MNQQKISTNRSQDGISISSNLLDNQPALVSSARSSVNAYSNFQNLNSSNDLNQGMFKLQDTNSPSLIKPDATINYTGQENVVELVNKIFQRIEQSNSLKDLFQKKIPDFFNFKIPNILEDKFSAISDVVLENSQNAFGDTFKTIGTAVGSMIAGVGAMSAVTDASPETSQEIQEIGNNFKEDYSTDNRRSPVTNSQEYNSTDNRRPLVTNFQEYNSTPPPETTESPNDKNVTYTPIPQANVAGNMLNNSEVEMNSNSNLDYKGAVQDIYESNTSFTDFFTPQDDISLNDFKTGLPATEAVKNLNLNQPISLTTIKDLANIDAERIPQKKTLKSNSDILNSLAPSVSPAIQPVDAADFFSAILDTPNQSNTKGSILNSASTTVFASSQSQEKPPIIKTINLSNSAEILNDDPYVGNQRGVDDVPEVSFNLDPYLELLFFYPNKATYGMTQYV